jgi:hypothetical protein
MNNITQLSKTLSAKLNQPEVLWSVALEKAAGLVKQNWISVAAFEQLANAAKSPKQLLVITDYASKTGPDDSYDSMMISQVDESNYSLGSWLEAIETFHNWIMEHSKSTDLETLLGFLSCCTEANPNTPTEPKLKEVVLEMLEQYGFDG